MNLIINSRHMEVTDAIKEYVEAKAAKLPRYLNDIQQIEVTLDIDADNPMVEFVVVARRRHTFVATHRDQSMYACIDGCVDKIAEQVRRHKDRSKDHQGPPHAETIGQPLPTPEEPT